MGLHLDKMFQATFAKTSLQSGLLYCLYCRLHFGVDLWTKIGVGLASCQVASAHHLPFEVWSRGMGWGQRCCIRDTHSRKTPPSQLAFCFTLDFTLDIVQWTLTRWNNQLCLPLVSSLQLPGLSKSILRSSWHKLTVSPLLWLNLFWDYQIEPNRPLSHQEATPPPLA